MTEGPRLAIDSAFAERWDPSAPAGHLPVPGRTGYPFKYRPATASSRAIAILDHLGVHYETVDVLQDAEIRGGIKQFSDWPTVPQLYVKGEFVGGSDIMMEMFESGELKQLVEGVAPAQ